MKNKVVEYSIPPLTEQEIEFIKSFWSEYNYKPDLYAFQWFYNISGIHDPKYITTDFYASRIIPSTKVQEKASAIDDKNLYDLYFYDIKMPKTIVRNVNGIFLNHQYEIITYEEAIQAIKSNSGDVVVKASVNSCRGEGVRLVGANEIEGVFKEYGINYIVQEKIEQHPVFAAFNQSSSNVVRITSVLVNGKVYLLSPTIRIGDSGSFTDQGGERQFCVGITHDGKFKNSGLATKNSIHPETVMPNGFVFGGIDVPGYAEMNKLVKKLHPRLANFPIIGWDFITSITGEVVLIECNLSWSGILKYQELNGPLFAEHTQEILCAINK